ncbi:hypothetical protein SSX86_010674 [Deinandra increscens subsp. villosa]|uniref:Uncharacterized protein n=1 Tax=Deinandra increscens subsp. villosa TaxID=3103831 RepID=A0AAP0H2K8_9ASTR
MDEIAIDIGGNVVVSDEGNRKVLMDGIVARSGVILVGYRAKWRLMEEIVKGCVDGGNRRAVFWKRRRQKRPIACTLKPNKFLNLLPYVAMTGSNNAKSLSEHYLLQETADVKEGSIVNQKPMKRPDVKLETAPADYRFPTTNQSRHCFTRYVEYHRCVDAKGEGAPECNKFAKYYRSLCPGEWVDKWNEQRENGIFPGPL